MYLIVSAYPIHRGVRSDVERKSAQKVIDIRGDGRAMDGGGLLVPSRHIEPTWRASAPGRPARRPPYATVSPSAWVSMGYAAPRSAPQEHRLGLLCPMARRWDLDEERHGLTRTNPRGRRPGAHAECHLHRESIGPDHGGRRPGARRGRGQNIKGRKRHIIVDTLGLLLAVCLT